MIIGETINSEYDGYEEENYDYLFKRKSKEERQQKKTVRQEKRAEKKQVKQVKRQEKKATKAANPKKHPILGNFGLFNKNKKKEAAAAAKTAGSSGASGSSGKKEADSDSGSSSGGEASGGGLAALAAGAAGLLNKSEGGNTPANESAGEGNEGAKMESKELDANGNPKKQAGMGAMFGFVCLGITILLVGVAIYKADKKPVSELQPLRAAA